MRSAFIILDCSGSIVSDDTSKIGLLNDLVRTLIETLLSEGLMSIRVIAYANSAKVYCECNGINTFLDIPASKFGGRSNLGKAYELVNDIITKEELSLEECMMMLISDGEATDNYKLKLEQMDPDNKAYRIALSIGTLHLTTEKHANNYKRCFNRGYDDRDDFIDAAVEFLD